MSSVLKCREAILFLGYMKQSTSLQGLAACQLGSSFVDKGLLFAYYFSLRISRKLGKMFFSHVREINISYENLSFSYHIANLDDYRILEEMFVNEQYKLEVNESINTIVDLGSNVGTSIIYFLAKYPAARIYGVEPVKYCFELLTKTVGHYSNVTLEKKAAGGEDGKTVPIYIHPTGHSGSSNFFIEGGEKEEVPTISMDALVQKYGLTSIDILKVDIEGIEYEVFKNFKNLSLVKYILVEVHPFLSGHSVEEFLALCSGFEVIEIEKNAYTSKVCMVKLRNKLKT